MSSEMIRTKPQAAKAVMLGRPVPLSTVALEQACATCATALRKVRPWPAYVTEASKGQCSHYVEV